MTILTATRLPNDLPRELGKSKRQLEEEAAAAAKRAEKPQPEEFATFEKIKDAATGEKKSRLCPREMDAAGWLSWGSSFSPVVSGTLVDVGFATFIIENTPSEDVDWQNVYVWRWSIGASVKHEPGQWRVIEKKPDADGWTAWAGGECPVAAETLIRIKARRGSYGGGAGWPAGNFTYQWRHDCGDSDYDIIAYKIIEAPSEAVPMLLVPTIEQIKEAWANAGGWSDQATARKYRAVKAAYGGEWRGDINKVPAEYRAKVYAALKALGEQA